MFAWTRLGRGARSRAALGAASWTWTVRAQRIEGVDRVMAVLPRHPERVVADRLEQRRHGRRLGAEHAKRVSGTCGGGRFRRAAGRAAAIAAQAPEGIDALVPICPTNHQRLAASKDDFLRQAQLSV